MTAPRDVDGEPADMAGGASRRYQPALFVVFGVTGDLAARKILPALYALHTQGLTPGGCWVLGVGRGALDDAAVREIAADIGSDVPFCLTGGAAWMRGRGEIIEPLDLTRGLAFIVAIPPFRLATPAVYAAWDDLGGPVAQRSVPAPRRVAGLVPDLANDLEPAAEAVEPRLVEFRAALEATTGRPALLAGSGSAYVVPVPDARLLPELVQKVGQRMRVPVVGTTSVSRGVRLDR